MATKRKKVTVTMEQKLQDLFRIDAGESVSYTHLDVYKRQHTLYK